MKVLILGGVAAGTKAAAKFKREDRSADVTILTKDKDISYAGCGLPYYVGGLIESREELIVNTPEKYTALTGVKVITGMEATALHAEKKTVTVRKQDDGEVQELAYDKLIIATGASPVLPPIEGIEQEGIFSVRTPEDAIRIRSFVSDGGVKRAVVVGGGFIGLEMAENLKAQGVSVTVIDAAGQLLPEIFDPEMAGYIKKHLTQKGIRVLTNTKALASQAAAV